MPDIILEDPTTGNSWTVTAPDEATAIQVFEKNRGAYNLPPETQIQVRKPAEPGRIETNEQGNYDLPESPNFPEMNQPGEAAGKEATADFFRMGPNAAGKERTKDMSMMQILGRIDQALGREATSSGTLGLLPAAEKKIRDVIGPTASSALFFDKPMDQLLEEGSELVGPLPRLAAGITGGSGGVAKALPESWLLKDSGTKGVLARTGAAPIDEAAIQQTDAALRGEDASMIEGTGTALGLQLLGEALTKGTRAGGTKFRQRNMDELAKNEELMAPAVRAWLKNVPYGPHPIPNADIRTQLGEDIVPVIRQEAGKAPRAYAELQRDVQVRREGELGRMQTGAEEITGTRPLDTAAGQTEAFKQQRLDPNLSAEYTQALQSKLPGASGWVNRGSAKEPQRERVTVPRAFLQTLTSSPRAYDAWAAASAGKDGGLATAESYARRRGGAQTQPGQAEIAWHTILKLENGGIAEQELARDLKRQLGDVNDPLKQLTARTHALGSQERGAALGDKIYTNPANLDKKAREARSDPDAWKAAGDAFVARFVEETSKGKLPKLTDQMRSTANELLGEQRASQLFRQYDVERRSRAIDEPIEKSSASVSPEALTKPAGKFKQALGAMARVLAASPGGAPGMLGAMGPAAARFLRDNPKALSSGEVEGLFSLLRQNSVPETQTNRFEKTRFNIATPGAKTITDEERRKRRGEKKPVPNLDLGG